MTHEPPPPRPPSGGGSGIRASSSAPSAVLRPVASAGGCAPLETAAPSACLVLFDVLPGLWSRLARERVAMVDLTEEESTAIALTMKRLALLIDEIGWQTRLGDLTEAQVRAVIEEAVEGFREAMADIAKPNAVEVPF